MTFQLHRRQVVGGSLAEIFAFFSDPGNLERITPPWLGFRIEHATDRPVRVGTEIRYRLRLHGISVRWSSRISEYVEQEMFADEQLTGPYRRWYHRHRFREVPSGVEIDDLVDYEMPFGLLGRVVHSIAVRRELRRIFDFRERQMAQFFPSRSHHSTDPGVR